MSPGETQETRQRRHSREALRRFALLTAITGAIVGTVVKYVPNNLTSDTVKQPTTTEQVIDTGRQQSIAETDIAKHP